MPLDRASFQPTRPLRGATLEDRAVLDKERFQPTRPLRGATSLMMTNTSAADYFNPRAPCGARLLCDLNKRAGIEFQPTRPLRGATLGAKTVLQHIRISTHAPLAGRDVRHAAIPGAKITISTHAPLAGRDRPDSSATACRSNFNPRAPCGARLMRNGKAGDVREFQPTRPLRGATSVPRFALASR